jgi:Arc/MetJ-type ribon-helix-helix transcriptional regulator
MIPIQIRITRKLVERVDELIEDGVYSNRSEAIRDAVRRHVINFPNNKKPLRK